MSQNIQLVKLITGDMVIGKIDEQGGKLKDPATLQTIPNQQGNVQMALLPFGYPFDNEIEGEISLEHVIYRYKNMPEDLKNKYLEASSNLTLSTPTNLQNLGGSQAGGGITNIGDLLK